MKGRKSTSVDIQSKRLKESIKRMGITQAQLAKEIGYSRETINLSLRKGKMDENCLDAVCRFLDVHPGYITGSFNDRNELIAKVDGIETEEIPIEWLEEQAYKLDLVSMENIFALIRRWRALA